MIHINCPCCHKNINEGTATLSLDNIKCPLDKPCVICLCELNSLDNTDKDKLVSCPKCGNLFHNNCWDEYVKHKNKSNETPIMNSLPANV